MGEGLVARIQKARLGINSDALIHGHSYLGDFAAHTLERPSFGVHCEPELFATSKLSART